MTKEHPPSPRTPGREGKAIVATTLLLTASFIIGKLLGVVRNSLFASVFGASVDADAFTQAFYLPDTIFNLVSGGALFSAFIPTFTRYLAHKHKQQTAVALANSALNTALAGLTLLALLAMLFAPQLVPLYVFTSSPGELQEIIALVRILLVQAIFMGGATVLSAFLQTRQRFLLPALSTLFYNAGQMLGLGATVLDTHTRLFGGHLGIYGATWGVVLGAALTFLVQVPAVLRNGLRYRPVIHLLHPGMRAIGRLMLPRMINAGMIYVAFGVDRALASLLPTGSTYGFFTAFQLMLLPINLFAMAVSTAAFPTLAALFTMGEFARLQRLIERTLRGIIFLSIPASLGLICLARPMIRLLYQHGHFTAQDTRLVYQALVFLAIGIVGHAAVEILTRSFYALHDSRTPVYVSLCQFAFMIGVSMLCFPWGLGGLGLALSLGVLGEAIALLLLLRQRLHGFALQPLMFFTLSVLAASLAAVLAALGGYAAVDALIHATGLAGSGSLAGNALLALRIGASSVAGGSVYLGVTHLLKMDEAVSLLRHLIRRRARR